MECWDFSSINIQSEYFWNFWIMKICNLFQTRRNWLPEGVSLWPLLIFSTYSILIKSKDVLIKSSTATQWKWILSRIRKLQACVEKSLPVKNTVLFLPTAELSLQFSSNSFHKYHHFTAPNLFAQSQSQTTYEYLRNDTVSPRSH